MAKIEFEKIEIKNFQSYGDNPTTFYFNKSSSTLIKGLNKVGKCVRGNTTIDVDMDEDTLKLFKEFMNGKNRKSN